MRSLLALGSALALALSPASPLAAQSAGEGRMNKSTFAGMPLRGIGPALMSGRIGDLAVNPDDPSHWFVAVASGGVWKTTNNGTTFTPVFDNEGSYSIGCVEMDPHNPNVVWVGTGENNSQRSVSWGDGVYKSIDGGKTWRHVGLKDSEHIGMIAIDPRDSDVVYVASQGPLWNSGGDRGLYKTTDGGETWERILHVDEHTGINEIHLDPRDPDVMYASAYQRRRRVWTLINGGPGSGIHKSTDGGETWRELTNGIPGVDKGRIGLDISPADPDVVYAIIEAQDDAGGFFRSTDRGESWEKRSGYMSTSPQYYNEIVCHPTDVDIVYSLNTWLNVTEDGGASFDRVPIRHKHVDDHALWIDPDDPDHMINGCDGGVYETWDGGANWDYKPNLPVTQFYRVAVDNSEPFYYVYGGTQDNNTQGGPSRTIDRAGITNADWFITVGGDGFEAAVDPEDPNTVYSQWQYGGLVRYDRKSGEIVDIKPRQKPGEDPYVFNWDSPLIISPHSHTRLYFGGRRLFRSDDRGNSWEAVSGDLTRGLDRNELEVMGEIQDIDAVAKHMSTSIYGNTVALDESPLHEGLIYVGTDDGLIQVSEDGGDDWREISVFPTVPDMTYVSDVTASRHDSDRVYATFDNHKSGDFAPYILRSDDRGQTWTSIVGDLPEDHVAYSIVEDHEDPDLLFAGTEFGVFFTNDGGERWIELSGVPTISVRDLEIQRRENDLVLATFGRGFYILDDYTPLRTVNEELLEKDAHIFPIKDAWAYVETSRLGMPSGLGFQGANYYTAPNPPFGAVFTYYLKDTIKTRQEKRKEAQETGTEEYPTVEEMREEFEEREPRVILTVRDADDQVVRRVHGSRRAGVHRVNWDLRFPSSTPIALQEQAGSPWLPPDSGPMVAPGTFTVTLSKIVDGEETALVGPVEFEVVPLGLATYAADDREAVLEFQRQVAELQRAILGAVRAHGDAADRVAHLRKAVLETPEADLGMLERVEALQERLNRLRDEMAGDSTLGRLSEPTPISIVERVQNIVYDQWWVSSPPTETHRDAYRYAGRAFEKALAELREIVEENLPDLESDLEDAGAPWTPGRLPEWEMR